MGDPLRYAESDGAVTFDVRVVARASRTALAGLHDGALKVRIAAPPVDGAANEELIRFLARTLSVPARAVEIVSGQTSKSKRVRVTGASAARVAALSEVK